MCEYPPIRLDCDDKNINWDIATKVEVLLNGIARNKIISYDCEARMLKRHLTDGDGSIVIDDNGEVKTETLYGDVAVRWKDSEGE